ncbi:aldolase [Thermodesulfobacterium sp. TA1]|uniref:class II fructose-bisphosphate aldolase n=1 Tax=Thermodesulfobacterium sp. TA1 TaxID=2234087 RepID=UPI00123184AF|nr:class II fructose-bisphosphate aldolase [Thermodesulfobacterium sp. TA1]QER42318.1 aldolase [Thermodesulfobacterium sp. TA1]
MEKQQILAELTENPKIIDRLIYQAVFEDRQLLSVLHEALKDLGIKGYSIYPLYQRFSKKFLGFTVPAINLRGMTYDVARAIFRTAKRLSAGAFIFEIAKSEIGYTKQPPLEYATVVLAAAFKEGYRLPVFIQGDHFQLNRKSFFANPEKEKNNLKNLIKEALSAQFYNIDIDASTLVDLEKKEISEQQRYNYEVTAELCDFVREIEPTGIKVTLGGEIGEIGGKNSTPEELRAFMKGLKQTLKKEEGISKISVQTGTIHGGVVLPDGKIAEVKLDFKTLKELSKIAREEFGLAGAVQHGASTLPEDYFSLFPENECVEVHLATAFQNFLYDHPALPAEFREKIYRYLKENLKHEWEEGLSESQFIYKTRKKGFGAFKKDWWDLDLKVKKHILEDMEGLFEKIFLKLNLKNTESLIKEVFNL